MMPEPRALLQSIFGFSGFRPGQEEIVDAVMAGRNTLAIMPTGGGKSLCFQLPALCREGVTVVISPLIALMRDQVRSLREAGVEAGALTSGNTDEETEDVFSALDDGRLKLLYMAPERLASAGTLPMLRRINCTLIAVDEAHCVSQWGHDFRPDYLRIGELRRSLNVPLAAFTATADEETRAKSLLVCSTDKRQRPSCAALIARTSILPFRLKTAPATRSCALPVGGAANLASFIVPPARKPKRWPKPCVPRLIPPVSTTAVWTQRKDAGSKFGFSRKTV